MKTSRIHLYEFLNIVPFTVPKYLYHRTNTASYGKIVSDGVIKHTGTPVACRRHDKFDGKGNDMWRCVFLADSRQVTSDLTFGGEIVLKIRTKNLNKDLLRYDERVGELSYGHSFAYSDDIPTSEIVEVRTDKWKPMSIKEAEKPYKAFKKRMLQRAIRRLQKEEKLV